MRSSASCIAAAPFTSAAPAFSSTTATTKDHLPNCHHTPSIIVGNIPSEDGSSRVLRRTASEGRRAMALTSGVETGHRPRPHVGGPSSLHGRHPSPDASQLRPFGVRSASGVEGHPSARPALEHRRILQAVLEAAHIPFVDQVLQRLRQVDIDTLHHPEHRRLININILILILILIKILI